MQTNPQSAVDISKALAGLDDSAVQNTSEGSQGGTVTLKDDPAIVAKWMLDVLSQIAAFDDTAVSHLVMGFLKHASGGRLLSVEKTAMQISGLARIRGEKIVLSEEGMTLLSALTFSTVEEAKSPSESFDPSEPVKAKPGKREPFALLRFGDQSFEIADGDEEGKLVYRMDKSSDDWLALRSDRESGWDVIGAEMLTHAMDVFETYIGQHVIRLKDDNFGPDAHVFEVEGIRWWVRVNGADAEFSLNPKDGWTRIPESIQASSFRELGIAAAQQLVPDFKNRIAGDVRAWVLRMAHAAAITPIMPAFA